MSNKRKNKDPEGIQLPKDVLTRIHLGHSFAEYDLALHDRDIYVQTPALNAALNPELGKAIFVGRRGTGKTAIASYLDSRDDKTAIVRPGIFSPASPR